MANDTVGNTTVTISGLEPHSTYEVVVYPVNDFGLGAGATINIETEESGKQLLSIMRNNTMLWLKVEVYLNQNWMFLCLKLSTLVWRKIIHILKQIVREAKKCVKI